MHGDGSRHSGQAQGHIAYRVCVQNSKMLFGPKPADAPDKLLLCISRTWMRCVFHYVYIVYNIFSVKFCCGGLEVVVGTWEKIERVGAHSLLHI